LPEKYILARIQILIALFLVKTAEIFEASFRERYGLFIFSAFNI